LLYTIDIYVGLVDWLTMLLMMYFCALQSFEKKKQINPLDDKKTQSQFMER